MAFADTHPHERSCSRLQHGTLTLACVRVERHRWVSSVTQVMYPMQPYEVHSKVVFWDDTFQFFTHRFVCPDTGKLLVEAVTRTIIKDHKRNTIQFEKVLEILDVERERPTEMPDVVQGFLKWDAATKVHMESVQVKPEMEKKEILNTA
ncbi:unnamed protein product [Aphanomyces euteiches]